MTSVHIEGICHFEDHPERVYTPELLEAALFEHPDVTSSDIEASLDRKLYVIDFVLCGKPRQIVYAFESSSANMQARLSEHDMKLEGAKLHLIDMEMDGDPCAGLGIYEELQARGISPKDAWFLTAYPEEARRCTASCPPARIIAKHESRYLISDILERILG